MERYNQVAGIVYRNICAEVPKSKWETPPKVVENDRAKILWDFQIQTDKQVVANIFNSPVPSTPYGLPY